MLPRVPLSACVAAFMSEATIDDVFSAALQQKTMVRTRGSGQPKLLERIILCLFAKHYGLWQ